MKVDTKKRVHTEPALKVKSPSKKLFNLSARQEYHQGEKRVPLLSFLNYQIISYFQNEVKDFQQKNQKNLPTPAFCLLYLIFKNRIGTSRLNT